MAEPSVKQVFGSLPCPIHTEPGSPGVPIFPGHPLLPTEKAARSLEPWSQSSAARAHHVPMCQPRHGCRLDSVPPFCPRPPARGSPRPRPTNGLAGTAGGSQDDSIERVCALSGVHSQQSPAHHPAPASGLAPEVPGQRSRNRHSQAPAAHNGLAPVTWAPRCRPSHPPPPNITSGNAAAQVTKPSFLSHRNTRLGDARTSLPQGTVSKHLTDS